MFATVQSASASRSVETVAAFAVPDPLEHDAPGEEAFAVSRRSLCRIATVAAEAGARFQRDGGGVDPMAWMLAPRRMFGGSAPLDACLDRDGFLRGVLVHGLGLDPDTDAEAMDDLLADDGEGPVGDDGGPEAQATIGLLAAGPLRLFTATVVSHAGGATLHAFHASLAGDAAEIAARLGRRFVGTVADVVVMDGFDPADPMVAALVAPAIADTLVQVAADPTSPLAAGLDLSIEQRFFG